MLCTFLQLHLYRNSTPKPLEINAILTPKTIMKNGQKPKLMAYIPQMQRNISATLEVADTQINVKATTEEKLGFTGDGSAMAAHAVCILEDLQI